MPRKRWLYSSRLTALLPMKTDPTITSLTRLTVNAIGRELGRRAQRDHSAGECCCVFRAPPALARRWEHARTVTARTVSTLSFARGETVDSFRWKSKTTAFLLHFGLQVRHCAETECPQQAHSSVKKISAEIDDGSLTEWLRRLALQLAQKARRCELEGLRLSTLRIVLNRCYFAIAMCRLQGDPGIVCVVSANGSERSHGEE